MKKTGCTARQYSDQMICDNCGLVWDTNDPEPPQCKKEGDKAIVNIKEILKNENHG